MSISIELKRKAIEKNRAGFEGATDQQINIIWSALSEQAQHDYVASVQNLKPRKGKDDAVSTKQKTDIHDNDGK